MKMPLLIAVAGLCVLPNVQADIIVQYDLTGSSGNEAFIAGIAPITGITALNLTRGPGLANNQTGANSFNSSGWESAAPSNPSDALEYLSFGFQVGAGTQVVLDNLALTTRSSNSGPGTLGLYSNIDGFTNLLYTFTQSGEVFLNSTITGLESLGTLSNQTVEFRIIEIGNTRATGTDPTISSGTFRLTNFGQNSSQPITFSGTVTAAAIPEPSVFLSCLIATFVCAATRRRQKPGQSKAPHMCLVARQTDGLPA